MASSLCVCVPISYKDSSDTGLGPLLLASFYLPVRSEMLVPLATPRWTRFTSFSWRGFAAVLAVLD